MKRDGALPKDTLGVETFAWRNFGAFRGFELDTRKFIHAKKSQARDPRKLIHAKKSIS